MAMAICRDIEGWHRVSRLRDFDFTPCFEEGVIISGLLSVVFILTLLRTVFVYFNQPLERSHKSIRVLAIKLVLLGASSIVSIANVLFVIFHPNNSVPVLHSYLLEPFALTSILIFSYFNHTRTRSSSTLLLIFWPLYFVAIAAWIRTVVSRDLDHFLVILSLKCATLGLAAVAFGFECKGPEFEGTYDSPVLTANIYSIWSFSWMSSLVRKGATQFITEDDLPPLKPIDESVNLGEDLKQALKNRPLWRALFIAYGGPYAVATGFKVIQDLLAFLQPQLLRWLLSYISRYQDARFQPDDQRPSELQGFAIAMIMFIASVTQTICVNQYFQRAFETGMRARAGLVTLIYAKSMVLANDEHGRASGDIVNLMSVDATRLQDFCTYGLMAVSGPLQITLAFVSLYNLLGWAAFVGVAIMIIAIPVNTYIARILKGMYEEQMKNRDKRTRLMSDLLSNIKSIKFYAWEFSFIRRILEVRNEQELKMLRNIGIVTSCHMSFWTGIPLVVAFSSFATAAIVSSRPLTSDLIFPSISLFMLLQFPLEMVSQVTSNIIEAAVSIKRLSSFLKAEELQMYRTIIETPVSRLGDSVLSIKNADFSWSKDGVEATLEGINLSVKKGELLGLFGRVGAGKSSLLSAILGDINREEGEVVVHGSIAYAPQHPWILSATVRDNILFSHEYDEIFYNLVIEGCALGPDLMLLPQGDMTEVGEKGITLSGGQQARISLARAVYARADLVLLDDCLAAVDSHVARHIFDNVIGPNGLLSTKARILVTNSISFVKQFDSLAFIRRGILLEHGSYQALSENPTTELYKLIQGHGSKTDSSGSSTISGDSTPARSTDLGDDLRELTATVTERLQRKGSFQKARIFRESSFNVRSVGLIREHQEQGSVKMNVYKQYIYAASKTGFILYLCAAAAQQATAVLASLTLRYWGEHNQQLGNNFGMFKYLLVYGLFVLSSSILGATSAIILWVYCALRSARHLHDSMLESLMRAPLSFFELTPSGRILNLFSRDTYVVDQILPRVIESLCRTFAVSLSIVVVIGSSFPPFLVFVVPLAWLYLRVMRYYLATSRELKRLDAVTRSPIFAWFSESLAGLSTIRAFNQQSIFVGANQKRIDHNQICYLQSVSVNRWLSMRLELLGALIILTVAFLAISALVTTGVDAGLVGLVLSYALNTTSSINWAVRSASEVEQNIVSVERILHQTEVEPEAPHEILDTRPDGLWPSRGAIEFRDYATKYKSGSSLVLKEVSLSIKPKEKIGVCGRTGAGKSSLLVALFRIIEPVNGTIYIDSVDITTIGLYDLRSGISIVPQSPDLFEGTLRENIDPVGEHSDIDIWIALDQAHLKNYVDTLPGKLDTRVHEGGSSLSAGQCQLLCFARALLRKSKILVLDEATSAVDLDTDRAIQDIMNGSEFSEVTVITIAHRLNTILKSDRIVVMDSGKVAEFDTPENLLQNRSSIFYSLVQEAGLIN